MLLIASNTVPELGPILGPEVPGEFFIWWTETLVCAVPRRMIFCSSLMLLAPGIFPKFWSTPSLISPSAPTITGTVSVLIPQILVVSISSSLYFESFSITFVELFRSDGTDTSISLQHYNYYYYYYYYNYSLVPTQKQFPICPKPVSKLVPHERVCSWPHFESVGFLEIENGVF